MRYQYLMNRNVERLFPFTRRAGILVVGRQNLLRGKKRLHFILMTCDISDNSRREILHDFAGIPIVQCYHVDEMEQFFGLHNCKVLGFSRSSLAVSIFRELKVHRADCQEVTPDDDIEDESSGTE